MSGEDADSSARQVVAFEQLGICVAEALLFWEPRRVYYNIALAAVVVVHVLINMPAAWAAVTFDAMCGLFMLAVIANVLYCAAYVVDLFVRISGLRDQWKVGRMILLIVGTLFASVIAHFVVSGHFDQVFD